MDTTPSKSPIQQAVELAGGQKALADALRVNPSLVWQWVNGHRPVAAHHCRAIEGATGGQVTCSQLRPDVFGSAEPTEEVA